MIRYMLDTNIASHVVRLHPRVLENLKTVEMDQLHLSAVTVGELLYGLSKRPGHKLELTIHELFARVTVLPWDQLVAEHYGYLRADLERTGRVLSPLDTMIAAHAVAQKMTLVTNDQAFKNVSDLRIIDWTNER